MIISHTKKFVFLRTGKTASSSIEVYLSQFCSAEDILTPLGNFGSDDEDEFKKIHNLRMNQNYIIKKRSYGIKNFLNFNFYNKIHLNAHDPINKVLKSEIRNKIKNYFFFCFVRNPFHWIVRSFLWHIYINNNRDISWIKSLSHNDVTGLFKSFLDNYSFAYFKHQEKIVSNDKVNIHVFKYEELAKNIKLIKNKLKIDKEKILLENIKFKKLKIDKKVNIDKEDEKIIFKNAEFFFENFYLNEKVPQDYKL